MKIDDLIKNRRSVRRYAGRALRGEDVENILEAGRWAPSGLNNQPWKFLVIEDKDIKDGLADLTESGGVIKGAPAVICVYLDKDAGYNRDKDIMAIGACIQNMLLCAESLGLGTCWLGEILNRKKSAEKYLKAGRGYELMAVIAIGYPAEKPSGRRKALKKLMVEK